MSRSRARQPTARSSTNLGDAIFGYCIFIAIVSLVLAIGLLIFDVSLVDVHEWIKAEAAKFELL